MIRVALLGSMMGAPGLVVVAQTGLDQALVSYGVAAPFAALCLYVIRRQEQMLAATQADNKRLVERLINVALPAQRRAAEVSKEVLAMLRDEIDEFDGGP